MIIVFWNIHKNVGALPILAEIVEEVGADIIALAEFPHECLDDNLLEVLGKYSKEYNVLSTVKKEKVKIVYKKGKLSITNQNNYTAVHPKLLSINGVEFNLIFLHLPSKFMKEKETHVLEIKVVCDEIRDAERDCQRYNTIVCGDFNLYPYEAAMVHPKCFNASMNASIALNESRSIQRKKYEYFYNPMWNLLGDEQCGKITGTFFFPKEPSVPQWSILDQVIIRPSVLPYFDYKKLQILTKGNKYNLLTTENKINTEISDHLPIKFEINV